eukprot:TRINITY_DN49374_c0_g1_i1.p1 TRINITY_DN49374_c0_g1~~TRINITY_DN49374_c0_g1_i1.p1  ORF type:complete len:530 (-),score=132.64 TRINITY_DN49374_c0_g1_i1:272-1819(-)
MGRHAAGCSWAWLSSLQACGVTLSTLTLLAGGERPLEEGVYTIVNKANGRRIFANPEAGLYALENTQPIFLDQLWRFMPQQDRSYAIVNEANGQRILAQGSGDDRYGFFATEQGPIYQDQRWWCLAQQDGSYVMVNAKSDRRIVATARWQGQPAFAAVADPAFLGFYERGQEDSWWFINQERDDVTRLYAEVGRLRNATVESMEASDAARNESQYLLLRLQSEVQAKEELLAQVDVSKRAAEAALAAATCTSGAAAAGLSEGCSEAPAVVIRWLPYCAVAAFFLLVAGLMHCRYSFRLRREVARWKGQAAELEQELATEVGDMVAVGDAAGDLGQDFCFHIFDTQLDQEVVRLVKIQCPGVDHADIEAELIFNGCTVRIRRKASEGVEGLTWVKRFQFRPSDGLFEFKEDQMRLEHGYLFLVFRAYSFEKRIIRFPRHFSLAASDADQAWDYSAESSLDQVDEAEAWWFDDVAASKLDTLGPTSACRLKKRMQARVEADTESTASTARVSRRSSG